GTRLIQNECRIGMLLKKAGGDRFGNGSFYSLLYDRRFVLAEGHDGDLPGFHDGADAHGQRLLRDVLLAEEAARGVAARHGVERDLAGAAVARGTGLVEADVPGSTDAQDLQVDAARPAKLLLVSRAVVDGVLGTDHPVRDVDVVRLDVNVVKKRLIQPAPVTLRVLRRHRIILVEVEGDDAREIEAHLLVQPDQLAVQSHGRGAGRQAQYRRPAR